MTLYIHTVMYHSGVVNNHVVVNCIAALITSIAVGLDNVREVAK